MSPEFKEMFRAMRELLNVAAALAAIVALPIYVLEAPARNKAAKLEDLQFAVLCADIRASASHKREQAATSERPMGQTLGMGALMKPEGAIAEIITAWANDKCEGVLPVVVPK